MRSLILCATALTTLATASVVAQPMPATNSTILSPLPEPPVDENAAVIDFLRAAENALAAGRNGEAQQAMEMAQTRLLDRSVPLFQTGVVSNQPAVKLISQGLQALAAGDRATSLHMIQEAAAALRAS